MATPVSELTFLPHLAGKRGLGGALTDMTRTRKTVCQLKAAAGAADLPDPQA